jgi:predicted CoA-binding protein
MRDLSEVLASAQVIAVLGAHDAPARAAFYVPDYLHAMGYRILPVNPMLVGRVLWGEPVVARLTDLETPVDLVDVFRRSESLPDHLDEFLDMRPPPRTVWFQSGIRHDGVARALEAAGLEVVQDRCTLAEHRARGLPPVSASDPILFTERPRRSPRSE